MPEDHQQQTQLINQQQLRRMLRERPGCTKLEATLGPAQVSLFCEVVFETELSRRNPGERYIALRDTEVREFNSTLDEIVQAESDQIAKKRFYAQNLLELAQQGELKQLLHLPGAPRFRRGQFRVTPDAAEGEARLAAEWISDAMHTHPYDTVLGMLRELVTNAPAKEVLGDDPTLLDRMHRVLAPGCPRYRGPNPEVSYPSSVGGRMLLETVFDWTAEAEWPPAGDPAWYDVALFYLGSIGTVQGYPDGNKRVARAAYALTLLRNRCQFHAPDREHLNELFNMQAEEAVH